MDREVRVRHAELLAARDEAAVRADALERLQAYRSLVASRAASGQGVTADLVLDAGFLGERCQEEPACHHRGDGNSRSGRAKR